MAKYQKTPIVDPQWDGTFIMFSDLHYGARACHKEAFEDVLDRIAQGKGSIKFGFGGDATEGKPVGMKHFDPNTLDQELVTIQQQVDAIVERVGFHGVAEHCAYWIPGNHDIYLSKDFDIHRYLCEKMGVPAGGYQNWCELTPDCRIFHFHGRRSLPRGAKDPIQREANQKAWLKRELEPLAGDCHVMAMSHTHALLVVEPIEQYALLTDPGGPDVRAAFFHEQPTRVETNHGALQYVPKEARFYVNTGTLRRSGGFGYTDYAEIGGYSPSPIGYIELDIKGGRCVAARKVIV